MNIESYKNILSAQRQELGSGGRAFREGIAIERVADFVDAVQHSADRTLALASLSIQSKSARQIEAALKRIDEGTFGTCQKCDEPVGEKRLRAIPWADLCIRCQVEQDEAERQDPGDDQWMADAA